MHVFQRTPPVCAAPPYSDANPRPSPSFASKLSRGGEGLAPRDHYNRSSPLQPQQKEKREHQKKKRATYAEEYVANVRRREREPEGGVRYNVNRYT